MKTDAKLRHDVIAELNWDPAVDGAGIGVEVKEGIVTLTGHADSYAEKWAAECAAQRVSGVNALAVEIDVRLPGPSMRSDVDIARSVENGLQWTVCLEGKPVKVMVESGWVTLSGEVDWEYQRLAAAASVRYLLGVTGVSNQLAIKAVTESGVVKAHIEAALQRRARADGHGITVDVHGDVVTLTGSVQSWSDRELAAQSAWSSPGVRDVIDKIVVSH